MAQEDYFNTDLWAGPEMSAFLHYYQILHKKQQKKYKNTFTTPILQMKKHPLVLNCNTTPGRQF